MIASNPCASELIHDPGYCPLKEYVIRTTGLAYYANKDEDFSERILRRFQHTGVDFCSDYLALLNDPAHGDGELDRLVEQLTIGETSFFRHVELFQGLRDLVLPDLIERGRDKRRLRIWSAGCSIGAEPFSVAILLRREFASWIAGWDVSILGTDINRQFLARARQGSFKAWDFRGAPQWIQDECFTRHGDEWWIRPEYKEWVSFQYHNLVRHPFPSLVHNLVAFDLVFCRNVIIYFNTPITSRIISQFHESLVDGGWLLAGHSEPSMDLFKEFRTVNAPGAILYQKCNKTRTPDASAASSANLYVQLPCGLFPVSSVPAGPMVHDAARLAALSTPLSMPCPHRTKSIEPDYQVLLENSRRLADAGYLEEAAASCQRLVSEYPRQPIFHFYLAMLTEQLGQHEQAETLLRRAIDLDRQYPLAHYHLAQIHQKRGRYRPAKREYQKVLELTAGLAGTTAIPEADHLRVADLRDLATMQLEVLHKP